MTVDENIEEDSPQQKGWCFYISKLIVIFSRIVLIGLLSYMIWSTKYYHDLWIWSIFSLIYNIIELIQKSHSILKKKYTFFVIQRRSLKLYKNFFYLVNTVLSFLVVSLGSSINKENIEFPHYEIFYTLFIIQCISLAIFVLVLVFLVLLLCYVGCCFESDQKKGTKPETISQHTVIKTFQEWVGIDTQQCSICMEEYGEDHKISKLPCGHFYHQECIEEWLKQARECPYCRQNILDANDLHT